jgi:hypothetical protein
MSYPRNAASPPPFVVGQVVLIADGTVQTTGVSARVQIGTGAWTAASGTLAADATSGFWSYTPTQAETNAESFSVVIFKSSCIGDGRTVITSASNVSGYAGTDQSKITNATATVNLSNTTIKNVTDAVVLPSSATINITGNITGNLSGSVNSVTGNVGGNVVGSVASVTNAVTVGIINNNTITAASIAASALDSKGNWNIGKTGYALTAGTGLGNQTANITGNLSGSVNSVTTRVTANTDQWNGVAVTGMPMPTFTLPANFSSLYITAGGYVIVSGDSFGNTLIIPNLASQSSVNTLITYVDTEVAAIKAKTDNLPASPAAVSDIPTANQNRDALLNASPAGGWTNGSFGDRWLVSASGQRTVSVTGSNHVAAVVHDFQAGVITAAAFSAGAINANALAADAASEIAVRVADEPLAGHTTAGTLGKVLSDAGSGVTTLLSRITSNVATMFGDLIAMIQGSGVLPKWTASALSLAPTSTGSVTATVAVPQILVNTAYNQDEVIVYRGTFWSFQVINLGDLTNLSKIWFTLRKRQNDTDSKSVIQIEQTAGLLIANGSPATNASYGSLTVSGSNITIQVSQEVTRYCEVTNNLNYDIKALTTGGQVRMLTISDKFIIENDVTRRIS